MNEALSRLAKLIENSNMYSINSYRYFVFPLKGLSPIDTNLLKEVVELMKKDLSVGDYKIFTFMVDGMIVALPLALAVEKPLVITRDFHYNMPHIRSFNQKTNYYERKMYFGGLEKYNKVEIVDCIVSSGGTILNAINEIEKIGCDILGVHTVIDKVDYGGSEKIRDMGYKFTSLLDVSIIGDKIHISPSIV